MMYTVQMEWLRKTVAVGQRAPFPEIGGPSGERANEALFGILLAHFDLHQSQGQRSCAREVLELAQQLVADDVDLGYRWLRKWARWLESAGRREDAVELLQGHLRKLRGKLRNPTRNAELRMELGILLDRAGRKEESLKFFRDAALRYRKLNHTYNLVAALFNSASVLHDLGQFGEALKVCRRALSEGSANYRDLSSHIALQMANSLESQGHTPDACNHYRSAEESYGQLGNRRQQSDILYRLGWLAVRSKKLADGARLLRAALEIKREHDYATGLAWYTWARAEAYRAGGATKKAVSHYRSALNLALSAHQDNVVARCRVVLFQLCAKSDQTLPAFVRLGNAAAADPIIKQGRAGLYLDHAREGYAVDLFREPGDTPKPKLDRRVLARLVHDLEKVTKATGVTPSPSLEKQRIALARWLERNSK
jgi:tetratricopeptide (TPR) repeat protein